MLDLSGIFIMKMLLDIAVAWEIIQISLNEKKLRPETFIFRCIPFPGKIVSLKAFCTFS